MSGQTRKRVLVVGAGAAGMSCADQLAKHPEKFEVTLIDAVDYCGGQAFSIPIDEKRHGASWMNQGVQGGSYIFRHTFHMFKQQGYQSKPVHLQVSFGKDDNFWSNIFPTEIIERHKSEIKRFNVLMSIVRKLELLFVFTPIWLFFKMFFFSKEFTDFLIMPTLALFLGTGNATPEISVVIMERIFTSPTYGMWYEETRNKDAFCSNLPPMVVFPNFSEFYGKWKDSLIKKGVNVRLSTELTKVISRSKNGVTVSLKSRRSEEDGHNRADGISPAHNPAEIDADMPETIEQYDELVLCVLADTAKKVLGKTISLREKFILGRTKWSDDITVTHWDSDYMERKYVNKFHDEGKSRSVVAYNGKDMSDRLKTAEQFSPMYYIRCYPEDSRRLEMAFDVSNYQFQFPKHVNQNDDRLQQSDLPLDRHIFQTIFLNKDRDSKLWAKSEINKDKIIRQDWWHQLCHSWTHYAFVVPWVWLMNGRKSKSTRFAGSWTLVNAHELAVISGLAAAWDLGAGYPEDLDGSPEEEIDNPRWKGFGLLCFRLYLLLAYGKWYRKGS